MPCKIPREPCSALSLSFSVAISTAALLISVTALTRAFVSLIRAMQVFNR